MGSSRHSLVTEICRDIRNQEAESEVMFQNLARFGDSACLHDLQDRTDRAQKQKIAAWIFVAVLALISIVGFYLLWLKPSGDCRTHRIVCGKYYRCR
jgi:hypothetical protein